MLRPWSRLSMADWLFVIIIAVGIAGAIVVPIGTHETAGRGGPKIVTLDAVKLVNAERAAVSGMLGKGAPHDDIALRMLRIGHEVGKTIRRIAGPGTIVLVRQAVVAGKLPDITDRVLRALGLPTKVPTVDVARYLDQAPTTADLARYGLWLQQRNAKTLAKERRKYQELKRQAGKKAVEQVLP